MFTTCTPYLRPIIPTTQRAYYSLNRKVPYNFFSISGKANMAFHNTSLSPATPYTPKYDTWPYEASDFQRYDEIDDGVFYRQARLVTHIDDPSIARLTAYYATALPQKGRIMDMCTSWKSFYPTTIQEAVEKKDVEVFGVGLNEEEMKLNPVFTDLEHWRVLDLNKAPYDVRSAWPGKDIKFDAVTCVVSIDYLVQPLEICRNLFDAMNEGGKLHLVVSNRCFPNKVVRRWMMLSEKGRLKLVGGELSGSLNVVDYANRLDRLFAFFRLEGCGDC
jgi:SAM-dependent methyltransferase